MFSTKVFVLLFSVVLPKAMSESMPSLCNDTYIHAADRLADTTIRVYKDNYYWELLGIPDLVVRINGPFPIKEENMGPVDVLTTISTVTTGILKGVTFKFRGDRLWSWHPNGKQRIGEVFGDKYWGIPEPGFFASFTDGDLDEKGYSSLIAFSGIHIYYYNTSLERMPLIGDPEGYIGGQYGEDLPYDLTAAFSYPDLTTGNYWVYLFKRDQYCRRMYKGVKGCPKWRDNKELFGCLKSG